MEPFTILFQGFSGDFLKLTITEVFEFPDQTCHWGGYDSRCQIEMKSEGFRLDDSFYISTGQIYQFYKSLEKSYDLIKGSVKLESYEGNLILKITFLDNGHVEIDGTYKDFGTNNNQLLFGISSDQTHIKKSLTDLDKVYQKYGGMKGLK